MASQPLTLDTFLAQKSPVAQTPSTPALTLDSFLAAKAARPPADSSASLPHPDDVDERTTATARAIAEAVTRPPSAGPQLVTQEQADKQNPQPPAMVTPFYRVPGTSVYRGSNGASVNVDGSNPTQPQESFGSLAKRVAMTPTITADDIDEAFPFLVGPFRIHAGLLKAGAGMTSPAMAAVAAGTAGLGALPGLTAKIASTGLSVYFASQAGKALADKYPQLKAAVKAKDWQAALELGGAGLADAAMFYGAGKHALGNALGIPADVIARSKARALAEEKADATKPTASITGREPYRPAVTPSTPAAGAETAAPLNLETFLQGGQPSPEKTNAEPEARTKDQPVSSAPASSEQPEAQPAASIEAEEHPPVTKSQPQQPAPAQGTRQVTGSINEPLTPKGQTDAEQLAASHQKPDVTLHANNDRSRDTALKIDPNAQPAAWAKPRGMGALEGRVIDDKTKADIKSMDAADEHPGTSPETGEVGERFSEASNRLSKGAKNLEASLPPGKSALVVMSGRAAAILDSGGDPAKMKADSSEFKFGQIYHMQPDGTLAAVPEPQPGVNVTLHGETAKNPSAPFQPQAQAPVGATDTRHSIQQASPPRTSSAAVTPFRATDQTARGSSGGPIYGKGLNITVPGEQTSYPAQYSIREAADVQPSHNPFSFEPNPAYGYQNDRDYRSNPQLSSLVVEHSGAQFNPDLVASESPTAEHGAPIVDARGNVLGGNSRAMSLSRVYQSNPEGAAAYRAALRDRAASYGLHPADIDRFERPVLVREVGGGHNPQNAITDFNKSGPAALSPAERAVADGRRLSPETVSALAAKLGEVGDGSTLAQALRGDNGADLVNRLVQDGVVTPQERNGLVDEREQLTGEAKDRIARMLVGRLFDSPASYNATPPELRGKLERVAPQILRVEDRPDWSITAEVREAVNALADARAHGIRNLDDLRRQASLGGEQRNYSPDSLAIAQTLKLGPVAATHAFRRYANDSEFSRENGQVTFFEPPTRNEAFRDAFLPPDRSGERGSVSLELLTLGAGKFWADDVAPRFAGASRAIVDSADDIAKVLAPQVRSQSAQQAALILRNNLSELARRSDQAEASLRKAKRAFDFTPVEENYEFIRRVEAGEKQQAPELDTIAGVLRAMLDGRRADVQALGKGKLQKFYDNYFPHIWADPKRAASVFSSFFGRGPLEGGKSFLKQRTIPTFQTGIEAGLKPVSDNPVDLVLAKVREMDKYVMAHETLNDWKASGLARYVDARTGDAPAGWQKVADPVGTVYGPSIQNITEYPNEGLWSGLGKVADALGINHERGFTGLRGAVGRARRGGDNRVQTMHGSAEDVLAHEIGHQIDWLAGSGKRFVLEYPDAQTVARLKRAYATLRDKGSTLDDRRDARAELKSLKGAIGQRTVFAKQLRDLADLRSGEKSYTHKREEKMAQLAEMWVGAREQFQRTAPFVFDEWKKFLDGNPNLHALRDIEGNTEVTPISQPYDVGGLVIRGNWYAPEGAARILNNYLSPGLRDRSGIFRGILGLNNVLNQFQLGMSAFHLGFTAADTTVSKAALGFQALMRGKPIEAGKQFLATPFAPFTTFMQGDRLLKEWYTPGSQGAAIGNLVDNLVAAGGRARMDQMYRTQIGDHMLAALRHGNIIGAALRAPFAGVEWTSNLIMNEIVPRMKLGAFADLARFHLENLPPDATFDEGRRVLAQAWDSIENRLGELTYDNLFWDRTAKDLAMITFRSVGWNLGTLREIGGGIADTVVQPANAFRGKPVNLNRLSYILGLVTVSTITGAIYQYLKTGKGPQETEDYFFPKNGETDEYGRPQRVSLPTYVKDVYHWSDPVKTVEGKVAPIWTVFAEMIHNRDFLGDEIRNPDDPFVKQLGELAEYAGGQFIPIGVRNYQRETKLGASAGTRAEQFIGIGPAPADLDEGPGERLARKFASENANMEPRTPETAERRDLRQQLTRSLSAGKGFPAEVTAARKAGKLSKRDVDEAVHASRLTSLQRSFEHLGIDDAARVYAAADAGEKKQLQPMFMRKARTTMEDMPPTQKNRTLQKVREAIAGSRPTLPVGAR